MSTYWSLSAALDPWCVAQPQTAKDVSRIVKTLASNHCPFGIRGGGHGFFALSNSVADGVTIDLGCKLTRETFRHIEWAIPLHVVSWIHDSGGAYS